MVEQQTQEPQKGESRKRGAKLFPTLSFNDTLPLAKSIVDNGVGGKMRRLTLFDKLQKSPNSGPSRNLVITSGKYGLTVGGYQAEYLEITEDARKILSEDVSQKERREVCFQLAIQRQNVFSQLYERLKNKRLPSDDVIHDELVALHVPRGDLESASEVFLQNVRDLDLIREISGKETLISIEQILEELPSDKLKKPPEPEVQGPQSPSMHFETNHEPSVHIDIQIHIDSNASTDQIDQIFASIAKHIYKRED